MTEKTKEQAAAKAAASRADLEDAVRVAYELGYSLEEIVRDSGLTAETVKRIIQSY